MTYLPEQDPYSLNFQNAGYKTTLMFYNAASMLFNFSVHLSAIFLLLVLYLLARCCPRANRWREKVQYYLFWNGSIRLFMEAYMDLKISLIMGMGVGRSLVFNLDFPGVKADLLVELVSPQGTSQD